MSSSEHFPQITRQSSTDGDREEAPPSYSNSNSASQSNRILKKMPLHIRTGSSVGELGEWSSEPSATRRRQREANDSGHAGVGNDSLFSSHLGDTSRRASVNVSQPDSPSYAGLPRVASTVLEKTEENEKGRRVLRSVTGNSHEESGDKSSHNASGGPGKKRDQLVYRAKTWSASPSGEYGEKKTRAGKRRLSNSSDASSKEQGSSFSLLEFLRYVTIRYVFVYTVYALGVLYDILVWIVTFGKRGRLPFSLGKRTKGAYRTAKRLCRPFLHIETELDVKNEFGEDNFASTPSAGEQKPKPTLTQEQITSAQAQRSRLNDYIRASLKEVDVHLLQKSFKVQCCTWNVDQNPPPSYTVHMLKWLLGEELGAAVDRYHREKQTAWGSPKMEPLWPSFSKRNPSHVADERRQRQKESDEARDELLQRFPDLLVLSLQEVDMGGIALVKEWTNSSATWADTITEFLSIASDRQIIYKKIKIVQLVGLTLMVFCQLTHLSYISHVRLSLTRTGALNLLGNKGSVALRATIYGKRFIFIAAHFSAHKHNEYNRMMNYHASLKDLLFRLPQTADDESEIVRTYAAAVGDSYIGNFSIVDASCVKGKSTWDRFLNTIENETLRLYYNIQETHEILYDWESHILDQHDYVFFLGDLNSRLHNLPSATIFEMIEADMVDQLLCHDELRQGMVSGEVFDGFQEQWIKFHPTYKFDKGTSRYDTSRKKRDPAWCDRILFRILENNPYTSPSGSRINRTSSSGEFVASPLVLSGGVGRHNTDDSSGLQTEESSSLLRTVRSAPYQSTPVSVDSKENWVSLENLSDEQLQLIVDKQEKGIHSSSSTTSDESVGLTRGKSAFVGHAPERGPLQEESAFIEPNHPVWKRKRGFPTFRAATKSIFAKPPADTDDDVSPSVPQRPFPMIKNAINALQYYRVEELTMSDHKPVGGTFEVKVVHLPLEVMDRLLVGIGNFPEQD